MSTGCSADSLASGSASRKHHAVMNFRALVFLSLALATAATGSARRAVDWPEFLGRHDMTFDTLKSLRLLAGDLYPNGLWYESPCIESTLAAAAIIQDMLMQGWSDPAGPQTGPIRIFPAVPAAWGDVEFHDLLAEGAFLVSAARRGGRTAWIEIESLAGEPCFVMPNLPGPVRIEGTREHLTQETAPGVHRIDLRIGEKVRITPAD